MEPESTTRTVPPTPGFGSYTPSGAQSAAAVRRRIDAVDLLRGIVMVLMLLDHTRDFTHQNALQFDAADLARTTPALFFTRWVTHFCAPIFVFLAGTGAYLQGARGRSKRELSRFLVSRGFWFIALEFTVVRLVAFFDYDPSLLGIAQVIWVIGVSMIVLAALIHLPLRAVAAFGVGMIALHNLLDGVRPNAWRGPGSPVPSLGDKLLTILHTQGVFPIAGWPSPLLLVLYPLIPWVGVLAAGYALGAIYGWEPARRQRWLLRAGLAMVAAFVVVRAFNFEGNPVKIGADHGYGDPNPWRTEIQVPVDPSAARTPNAPTRTVRLSPTFVALSFLNTTKYPPSLLYLLMTLGPALLALRWFERRPPSSRGPVGALVTFGRVPFFFYLLQWPYVHVVGIALSLAFGKSTATYFSNPLKWDPTWNFGFPLWVTYLCWMLGVVLLYPLCRWFAGVKARRRDWWLGYL
ncbi:MAG TPA: heparan-alpha-glucosaminide N-acetyltransferase domain-containing protein [Gemmatimonadaceae bacterium]|nr:heparan-alpha-glucosaminide N-acetyltransferase domain-containing protein [Gemmatimonadaceae bacterium]